jgi:hypothetical protein
MRITALTISGFAFDTSRTKPLLDRFGAAQARVGVGTEVFAFDARATGRTRRNGPQQSSA